MNEPIVSIGYVSGQALDAVQRGQDESANPYPADSAAGRMWLAQFSWLRGMHEMQREAA